MKIVQISEKNNLSNNNNNKNKDKNNKLTK